MGASLVLLTIKEKKQGKLRKFLLLTGGSAIGFLLSVILHNLFCALGGAAAGILEVVFFVIAVPLCPIGFLLGTVGTIFVFQKKT